MRHIIIVCCAYSLAIICDAVDTRVVREKKIKLDDIERDNLASERASKNGEYKGPPANNNLPAGIKMQYGFVPMKTPPTAKPPHKSPSPEQYQYQTIQPQQLQYYSHPQFGAQYDELTQQFQQQLAAYQPPQQQYQTQQFQQSTGFGGNHQLTFEQLSPEVQKQLQQQVQQQLNSQPLTHQAPQEIPKEYLQFSQQFVQALPQTQPQNVPPKHAAAKQKTQSSPTQHHVAQQPLGQQLPFQFGQIQHHVPQQHFAQQFSHQILQQFPSQLGHQTAPGHQHQHQQQQQQQQQQLGSQIVHQFPQQFEQQLVHQFPQQQSKHQFPQQLSQQVPQHIPQHLIHQLPQQINHELPQQINHQFQQQQQSGQQFPAEFNQQFAHSFQQQPIQLQQQSAPSKSQPQQPQAQKLVQNAPAKGASNRGPYFAGKNEDLQAAIDSHFQNFFKQQPAPQSALAQQGQQQHHQTAAQQQQQQQQQQYIHQAPEQQYVYLQQTPEASNSVQSVVDSKGNLQYFTYVPVSHVAPGDIVQGDLTNGNYYNTVPAKDIALTQNIVQEYEQNTAPVAYTNSKQSNKPTGIQYKEAPAQIQYLSGELPQEYIQQEEVVHRTPTSGKYASNAQQPTAGEKTEVQIQKQVMLEVDYPKHKPQSLLESYVPSILQYQYYKAQQDKIQQQFKTTLASMAAASSGNASSKASGQVHAGIKGEIRQKQQEAVPSSSQTNYQQQPSSPHYRSRPRLQLHAH